MHAAIAQSVERIHGKDEVTGSNPVRGSIFFVEICHSDKNPGCGGREFHIKNLFFEGLLVILRFAEAKN